MVSSSPPNTRHSSFRWNDDRGGICVSCLTSLTGIEPGQNLPVGTGMVILLAGFNNHKRHKPNLKISKDQTMPQANNLDPGTAQSPQSQAQWAFPAVPQGGGGGAMIVARRCPPFSWARLLGLALPAAPARAERCTIRGAIITPIEVNQGAMFIASGQPDTRVAQGRPV